MIRKRWKPVTGNRLAMSFLRDVAGTAAQKLALFERLKSAGVLDSLDAEQVRITRNTLEMLAAMEKESSDR